MIIIQRIKEFFELLFLKFIVAFRNFSEFSKVVWRYYRNRNFAKVDIYLLRNYIHQNPYQIAKEFLIKKGEKSIYCYGETPLTTLDLIATECDIQPSDLVYELGSGRGRSCFWLHFFKGCRVVGVEFVPIFVHIAQKVKREFKVKNIKFVYRDILEADFSDATVIYYYGTSAETAFILKLIEKLKNVSSGTKIITVSYPLTAYIAEPTFELVKTFSAPFVWGSGKIFLQIRK